MKSCIYNVIGHVKLSYYDLLTVLSSVQNVINSQPLMYRCSEYSGLEEITPNSSLRPYANKTPFFNTADPEILNRDLPSRRAIKRFLKEHKLAGPSGQYCRRYGVVNVLVQSVF